MSREQWVSEGVCKHYEHFGYQDPSCINSRNAENNTDLTEGNSSRCALFGSSLIIIQY